MTDLVTFGESMGALTFTESPQIGARPRASFGGAETNVAIGMARLGHSTAWVGSVGKDLFGYMIMRTLRGEGVRWDHARQITTAPTGVLVSRHAGLGTFAVDYHRKFSAGRLITPDQIRAMFELEPKIVHLTGITPALGEEARAATMLAVELAGERGVPVSFDVNFRSRLWDAQDAAPVLAQIARGAHVVFGGTEELELLTGESEVAAATQRLLDWGVSEVVWKDSTTVRVTTPTESVERPGRRVTVVDTIGAGDAFVAGYLSGWLEGLSFAERLDRGHLLGAFAVGTIGDWEGGPTREELTIAEISGGEVAR